MKKNIILVLLLIAIISYLLAFVIKDVTDNTQNVTTEVTGAKINFLDIGQGDATFIELPTGEQILIDCSVDSRILEKLGEVMPFYDKTIDYLFITHPDLDHYGGCIDVLDRFEVKNIVYTGLNKNSKYFKKFISMLEAEGSEYLEIMDEEQLLIGDSSINFIYPDHAIKQDSRIPGLEKKVNVNNTSLAFIFTFADKSILFTGDAESELEEYFIEMYKEKIDVDMLKAGHHGSSGSSIQDFVDLVSPKHTIFSAGKGNSYGHPSPRVIRRAERTGSEIWRTDLNGDILVTITTEGIYVETQYTTY